MSPAVIGAGLCGLPLTAAAIACAFGPDVEAVRPARGELLQEGARTPGLRTTVPTGLRLPSGL